MAHKKKLELEKRHFEDLHPGLIRACVNKDGSATSPEAAGIEVNW